MSIKLGHLISEWILTYRKDSKKSNEYKVRIWLAAKTDYFGKRHGKVILLRYIKSYHARS